MKNYETPVAEITTFTVEDVVTTSTPGSGNPGCEFELPE